jgi:hypothetical protein
VTYLVVPAMERIVICYVDSRAFWTNILRPSSGSKNNLWTRQTHEGGKVRKLSSLLEGHMLPLKRRVHSGLYDVTIHKTFRTHWRENMKSNMSALVIVNSLALARKRTIPTERPPLVGEVIVNFCATDPHGS